MTAWDVFKNSLPDEFLIEIWEGNSPSAYANNIGTTLNDDRLKGKVGRDLLFEVSADKGVNTQEICIAILAWGGMNRGHFKKLFTLTHVDVWLTIAQNIRNGLLSRYEAYEAFKELQADGGLKGMGPAYFTKLIYFLMPDGKHPRGYIMDQWVGCSVNIIEGRDVVLMNATYNWSDEEKLNSVFTVSNANTGKHYEEYCQKIVEYARRINLSPDLAESALMSQGGRLPAPWRAYVKDRRKIR